MEVEKILATDVDGRKIWVEAHQYLPCGGIATYDDLCYRCEDCGAVVGSMAMPRSCKEEFEKQEIWQKLGGKSWSDRSNGR